MTDASAAAVFCGKMCNGCQDDCAACATMACGDCGGCERGRLSRRARVAGAALALLQIGAEFGFNPNQLRGPDGRWIRMGGRGSAGKGGLPKGSGLKNPRVDASGNPARARAAGPSLETAGVKSAPTAQGGTTRYDFTPKNGTPPNWYSLTPSLAPKWIDALSGSDSEVMLQAGIPSPDRRDKTKYDSITLQRNADGDVALQWGPRRDGGTPTRLELTGAEASRLAELIRENADRDQAARPRAVPDSPEVAARKKEGRKLLSDASKLIREVGDEFAPDEEEMEAAHDAVESDSPNLTEALTPVRRFLEQYGRRTPAGTPGRAIAKRNYSDGDRVPLADGSEGTVVGGHHRVAGRPGLYVAVRPDDGGKLKEVAVDAIRKRQVRQAEAAETPLADRPDDLAEVIAATRAREGQQAVIERAEAARAERIAATAARDAAAEASRRETEQARARVIARGAEKAAQGPPAAGFTPMADKDWNMLQKRLGKRTPRLDPDGELQPGDIVPTKDGKWQEVLGPDPAKFYERNGMVGIKVRDDAKGYVHGEDAASIKKRIEAYAAEKAWRDSGGSKDRLDGNASGPVDQDTGRRPGEPPVGEDGKYAKPTTQYAVHNGQVYTRTSRNPYRYASVVSFRDPSHPDAEGRHDAVWSWHRTAEAAQKGTLTSDQRRGLYVSKVIETGFEDPKMGNEVATDAPPSTVAPQPPVARPAAPVPASRAELNEYNRQIEGVARMVRDAIVDGEGPFWMDKYKERELSDRLQELVDAQDAGQDDKADRIIAQIRKILRDTDVQTEDELPVKPGGVR